MEKVYVILENYNNQEEYECNYNGCNELNEDIRDYNDNEKPIITRKAYSSIEAARADIDKVILHGYWNENKTAKTAQSLPINMDGPDDPWNLWIEYRCSGFHAYDCWYELSIVELEVV